MVPSSGPIVQLVQSKTSIGPSLTLAQWSPYHLRSPINSLSISSKSKLYRHRLLPLAHSDTHKRSQKLAEMTPQKNRSVADRRKSISDRRFKVLKVNAANEKLKFLSLDDSPFIGLELSLLISEFFQLLFNFLAG